MESAEKKQNIVENLKIKAVLKQKVYDNTYDVFIKLKKILAAMEREINSELGDSDKRNEGGLMLG